MRFYGVPDKMSCRLAPLVGQPRTATKTSLSLSGVFTRRPFLLTAPQYPFSRYFGPVFQRPQLPQTSLLISFSHRLRSPRHRRYSSPIWKTALSSRKALSNSRRAPWSGIERFKPYFARTCFSPSNSQWLSLRGCY